MKPFILGNRKIGDGYPPFIIAEVGINHEGEFEKALQMVDAAVTAGADCVKFQCHITEEEMIPNQIVPENAQESLWDIIKRCELAEEEEIKLKEYCDQKGILYLSTPFSREASDRLDRIGVLGFKIGSGECNNLPLIEHIARKKKPIILSTGMNDVQSIRTSVDIIKSCGSDLLLMHCTSMYPTPYEKVCLGAIDELKREFDLPVGLSDHSMGIYTVLGAVALGACAVEKHFTISRKWPGPDNPISIEPDELAQLVKGARAIFAALGGKKVVLPEEQPVINFAYACVVSISDIKKGDTFTKDNIWVKRPGTGEIFSNKFNEIIGRTAGTDIKKDEQLRWDMIDD